ncbi:MAG: hypothetical protein WAM85_06000 [Terracidiphilus sp.]
MILSFRNALAKVALCSFVLPSTVLAMAQPPRPSADQIVSRAQVAGIGVGIAGIGAAIGIGVFYAVHHGHSMTGCAVSAPNALQLQNQGDRQMYDLVGALKGINPGERVRVVGKKQKQNPGVPRQFLVEKVSKDFGACMVESAKN